MSEKKYSLTLARDNADPKFKKLVRDAASTKPKDLARKRLELAQQQVILEGAIQAIHGLQNRLVETQAILKGELVESERARLDDERLTLMEQIQTYYQNASLLSLTGLYAGFGLLSDMLSVELVKTNKDGKKVYSRVSSGDLLFDAAIYLEDVIENQELMGRMIEEIGIRQNKLYKSQFVKQKVPEAGQDLEPEPEGVTDEDKAQAEQVKPEQVEDALRGRRKPA